jgi:hypothetical protein
LLTLDRNKERTYKNGTETTEVTMFAYLKDLLALAALGAFGMSALAWMDALSRLV